MFSALPRDFNKEFNPIRLINNPKSIDNSGKFTPDGVFSEKVFGHLSNGIDYSCECGKYQGEFNLHYQCEDCKTEVEFKGLLLSREGWIDLKFDMIHPVFYRYIKKIIGPTVLNNMLRYKPKREINGNIIEPLFEPPYTGIGMINFVDNFEDILQHFIDKKKDSVKNDDTLDFLLEHRDSIFIDKFPVINARLRPAIMVNGEFTFDEISNNYNNIIKNAEEIERIPEIQMTADNILDLVYKNQILINEVFDRILDSLSNKEGFIRGSLVGSRLNMTARNVITPLRTGYSIDECVLPYRTSIELMKPIIIQKLMKIKKISLPKANKTWFDATLSFNKLVHTIMSEIAKQDNVRIILNRNPTLGIGSILMLKIANIKTDINDVTLSINNLILPPISGDYDGDVLNIVAIYSDRFVELFSRFKPSNLMIGPTESKFNRNFVPFKDIQVGLEKLIA